MSEDNLTIPESGAGAGAGAATTTNKKAAKNLHIAHRRSPSELTTLMVEQYNLQRQLEAVQAQQKQIIQQQQLAQQQQFSYPPKDDLTPNTYRSHSRSSSSATPSYGNNSNLSTGGHRRTASGSNQGAHARRHSLGLNEAIKAAANQRQNNRNTLSPSGSQTSPSSSSGEANSPIGSFKFPPSGSTDDEPSSDQQSSSSHSRSRSAYGQQSFKFPPDNSSLLPPTPNFTISQSPERGHQKQRSHYRSNSRNFDPNGAANMNSNWRSQQQPAQSQGQRNLEPPSAAFVPGHKPRNSSYGGGSSISSLAQFLPNSGNSNNSNGGNVGRKSLFAPYLPQSSLPELINEGRLVTGTLRVNKKNRSDAYVSTDGLLDADIFICGSKDRNRALEGDLVAVELLVVDEVWESKKEKEEKKRRKDNTFTKSPSSVLNNDIHNDATSISPSSNNEDNKTADDTANDGLARRGSLKQRPTMKKNDDVEVEGQSLLLVEEEEINDEVKPLYAGHVVAVVDRIPGQLFSGTLGLLRPAQAAQAAKDKKSGKESSVQTPKAPKIVWFKPTDKKVPLIAIPTEQAPKDFVENHEKYSDQLFVASIKRWPITSLHPFGTLVSKLGKIEDSETEVDSILRDNNFLCDEYKGAGDDAETLEATFVKDIPSPEAEFNNPDRTEYLNDYIISFTQNGQFVDHALHVKRVSNSKIELGFHAADVSFFIQPGSTLDRKSKKRSSSVFLPQKVAHLFPEKVNELISFKENEKNLAISVMFEIDTNNFEVEDLYIQETVIVPKQLVSYDDVDTILASQGSTAESKVSSATSDYIKTFSLIAKEFRRHRLENRELGNTPNLTLLDQLDDEKVRLDLNIFKNSLAYNIISEISHKVNNAIAAKVHAGLGDQALLRRHPLPTLQKVETFIRKATNLGFKIDTTSSATLQNSILNIDDTVKRQCVETLLYKCMSRGKYYIAGKQDFDSYGHYYFNLPLYTHFTAPLRRYADVIVHRQLKQVIKKDKFNGEVDLDALKATAEYCNFKKDCASNAQEQAIHLLLSQTINEISESAGQLLCMGTVVQVYESSFDVFIPEFGVEKRVHGDQLPLVKAEFDKTNRILELYWEKGVDSATYIPPDEKSSLSYRSSIKNKYRTSALQAAKIQKKGRLENKSVAPDSIIDKLAKLNLTPPNTSIPSIKKDGDVKQSTNTRSMPSSPTQGSFPKNVRTNSSSLINSEGSTSDESESGLAPYLQDVITRVEQNLYIQEIRELKEVPVLIRAEIGMALPCLTVRVLNPFSES